MTTDLNTIEIGRFTVQDDKLRSISPDHEVAVYENTAVPGRRLAAIFYGPDAWKRAKLAAHAMELWREGG